MVKNNKKKVILICIVIIVILIIVGKAIYKNNKKDKEYGSEDNNIEQNIQTEIQNNNTNNEEFVEVQKDGTRVNTSNKLKENKEIDGLNITNINLQTKGNETVLVANVENRTNEKKGDYEINIIAKDKNGKEIKKIGGYINLTKPGEITILRVKTSFDFANTYDIEITK